MQEINKKTIFAIVSVVLIAAFVFVAWTLVGYRLKKKSGLPTKNANSASGPDPAKYRNFETRIPNYLAEAVKNDLTNNTREIVGKVLEMKGNTLTVEAEIVDLERLPAAKSDNPEDFPKTKKKYTVNVTDRTEFKSAKMENIQVGQQVQVMSDDLIYKTVTLSAVWINFPYSANGSMGIRYVSGKIKEIVANGLLISAVTKDGKDAGVYKIKVLAETKVIKKDFTGPKPVDTPITYKDLKVGDTILVLSANVIADKNAVEAAEIDMAVLPANKPGSTAPAPAR